MFWIINSIVAVIGWVACEINKQFFPSDYEKAHQSQKAAEYAAQPKQHHFPLWIKVMCIVILAYFSYVFYCVALGR